MQNRICLIILYKKMKQCVNSEAILLFNYFLSFSIFVKLSIVPNSWNCILNYKFKNVFFTLCTMSLSSWYIVE